MSYNQSTFYIANYNEIQPQRILYDVTITGCGIRIFGFKADLHVL